MALYLIEITYSKPIDASRLLKVARDLFGHQGVPASMTNQKTWGHFISKHGDRYEVFEHLPATVRGVGRRWVHAVIDGKGRYVKPSGFATYTCDVHCGNPDLTVRLR